MARKKNDGTPCWSCGVLQGKHGKNCKAVRGAAPSGTGSGGGQRSPGRVQCGYRWTNPSRPEKRGQHFMHTCGNLRDPDSKDRMCEGPHLCIDGNCPNPTRSK